MQTDNNHRRMSLTMLLVSEEPSKPNNNLPITKSVKDRRIRNKTASAKYRAKKTSQYREMQKTIQDLLQQNTLLRKKLEQYQEDIPIFCSGANSSQATDHLLPTFKYGDELVAYSSTDKFDT
ncbi:hypothetical protein INT47_001698 [Mucor saturninus]|uniref:BZIP domain-containing protein n=1 Tax=Mucor saturninus TaxID=64648 RepID=A0A8H7RMG8_9FUNG|nr:hypothetical protein INT47_001698 [Mucor saturninus]